MKPAASCRRAPTSKARSASCVPMTACSSPSPGARKLAHYVEREITRLLAARSGTDRAADRTSDARRQCASPASRRRARWQDRSCRWWRPPSAPINCSAAPDRARPQSMRSPHGRWSRASRWRRPPAAPMISSGRAAKSAANRPRAKRQWRRSRPMATIAPCRSRGSLPHRQSRRSSPPGPVGPRRRFGISSDSATRSARRSRLSHSRKAPRSPPRPPGTIGRAASSAGLLHAVIFQSSFRGARSANPESQAGYTVRFRVCAWRRIPE